MFRRTTRLRSTLVLSGTLTASLVVLLARPARAEKHFGVGLMGTLGGNFLDKPDRQLLEPDIYPGYGGVTYGGGLVLDGRVLDDVLGLEVDVLRSRDKGSGDVTFTSPQGSLQLTHTIGQSAWHVPVLVKATIPTPFAGVQFMLGPEFVFPSDAESKTNPDFPGLTRARADSYTMVTAGVGVEIKIPTPNLEFRIPIGLRFSYNPGVGSDFADRVKLTSPIEYESEWRFAAHLTAGFLAFF